MILTCPNCGTQYVVKDDAVPPQGRQVRCAACKHSWHQDPEPNADAAEVAGGEAAVAPAAEAVGEWGDRTVEQAESIAEATMIEPRSGPEAEERAYEEAMAGGDGSEDRPGAAGTNEADERNAAIDAPSAFPPTDDVPPTAEAGEASARLPAETGSPPTTRRRRAAQFISNYDAPAAAEAENDEFSPFAEREHAAPRGRRAIGSIAMIVVAIAVLAAAFWFLAPAEWRARVGLGDVGKTPLELMITHPDRQKLASGQESLTISGRVINPTDSTHAIPPIYAQLKSGTGRVIYSWTIAPPAPSLGPRASTSFNSTEVDVPPGGEDLTISLGSPKS